MNNPKNKIQLGADTERSFTICNATVYSAFSTEGDGVYNDAPLLPELINDGVRLLVYAGNADTLFPPRVRLQFLLFSCVLTVLIQGNELWVENLETEFLPEFQKARSNPWFTLNTGTLAGEVRSAGGDGLTAGNVTFVNMYDAG
jgi:cathepsin A (carboxypeptidase C)